MPGGGVLSVPGCATEGACSSWEASWITLEYEVATIPIPVSARCPVPARALLAPAGGGTPLLVAPYTDGSSCSYRFDPWPGDHLAASDPLARPHFVPELLALEPPPHPLISPLAIGADAFVWASGASSGGVGGLRFGNRGALSRDLLSLLTRDDDDPSRPQRLVPDRPLTPPDVQQGEPRVYEGGALSLRAADAGVTFWVPDTRYDDVTVTLALVAPDGAERGEPPLVVLGDSELGGAAMPWPPPGDAPGPGSVVVRRRGGSVTLTRGGRHAGHAVPRGAVPLGLRVGAEPVVISAIHVERR
jgi:hypothetical protein